MAVGRAKYKMYHEEEEIAEVRGQIAEVKNLAS
jgi:hypothetical protein